MKRAILFIIISLVLILTNLPLISAQNSQKSRPFNISKFIPAGYIILDSVTGNLNMDTLPDMILVLKKLDEDTISNPSPKRLILLLTGKPNNEYDIAAKNETSVFHRDEGGVSSSEPYEKTSITQGMFFIAHNGGMGSYHWYDVATFKYSLADRNWYLYSIMHNEYTLEYFEVGDSIRTASHEEKTKTANDFGKVSFEKYDYGHQY